MESWKAAKIWEVDMRAEDLIGGVVSQPVPEVEIEVAEGSEHNEELEVRMENEAMEEDEEVDMDWTPNGQMEATVAENFIEYRKEVDMTRHDHEENFCADSTGGRGGREPAGNEGEAKEGKMVGGGEEEEGDEGQTIRKSPRLYALLRLFNYKLSDYFPADPVEIFPHSSCSKNGRMAALLQHLALVFAVLVAAQGFALPQEKVFRFMSGGRWVDERFRIKHDPVPAGVGATATEDWFDQILDHRDSGNTATWKQKYWYSADYYKAGGPVFMMLGGEGPESPAWVQNPNYEWTQLAQKHNAFLFLVEHRFYGTSHPTADMSVANLTLLSSMQAIEDFAYFSQTMRSASGKFPQLAGAKWVTFGGSYSGALSAWMRLKHPELIDFAVATSAPVQAEYDYVEYFEVVMNSITSTSQSCADSVRAGFNQITQLLQTAQGRNSLKNTFNICENIDITNSKQLQTFWGTILDPYAGITQYGGDNAGRYRKNLTLSNAVCRFHNNQSLSTMAKMQAVNNYFNQEEGVSGCNDINYQTFILFMKSVHYGAAQSSRAWYWQTCTEFAYFQSTDSPTAGPFFGGIGNVNVTYYADQCADIYGPSYTEDYVQKAVQATNNYYGGRDNLNSSYIILPNGSFDPWHALGKLTSSSDTIVTVAITGTAHCANMYPALDDDLQSLKDARTTIFATMDKWLGQ